MAGEDDVNTPKIAAIGLLGSLVVLAIVLFILVVYYQVAATQYREKELSQPNLELEGLRDRQQQKLAEYAWVDRQKGIVAVPIDLAMKLTLRDIAATKGLPPAVDIAPPASQVGPAKEEKHGGK